MEQISMSSKMNLRQAYLVMIDYLEAYYERNGKPDEIGSLLGQLSLWDSSEGKAPMDPAVFQDWLNSAKKVLSEEASGGYHNADVQLQ